LTISFYKNLFSFPQKDMWCDATEMPITMASLAFPPEWNLRMSGPAHGFSKSFVFYDYQSRFGVPAKIDRFRTAPSPPGGRLENSATSGEYFPDMIQRGP